MRLGASVELLFGHIPDLDQFVRIGARMLAAVILGAAIGIQRELVGKPAGLRTHALVTLAAAIFTLVPFEAGMDLDGVSRVIQGVATGIGFIGAGVILKRQDAGEVIGLTTAATVWAATAIGVVIGLGHVVVAAVGVALAWIVLAALTAVDGWIGRARDGRSDEASRHTLCEAPVGTEPRSICHHEDRTQVAEDCGGSRAARRRLGAGRWSGG